MNRIRTKRMAAPAVLVVILGVVGSILIGGISPAQEPGGTPPEAAAQAETAEAGWGEMTPERRAQAVAYSHTRDIFYFVTFAYGIVVLLVILYSGLSARMLAWAQRFSKRRFLTLMLYVLMFLGVLAVASLPFDYYLGYSLEHSYGLSNQSLGAWVGDQLKELAVSWVILTIIAGILYALIRRRPQSWWAWVGVVSIPLLVFLIILAPLVITPLFYNVTPMEDSPLKTRILNLASASGIDQSRVFVMDASRNTKKLNAYVTGLRGTKRIVLFDNLLVKMAPEETLFVVAHEIGHYRMHHIWLGLGMAVFSVFVFSFLAHRLLGRWIAAHRGPLGFDRLSSVASFPLITLVFTIFGFVASPLENAVSRHFEHQADVFALDLTADGRAGVGAFEKLAEANLSNPNPSTFIKIWRYGHPTLSERVRFARAYGAGGDDAAGEVADPLAFPGESRLSNVRQLTFGGENAEAYFNAADDRLVFQSTRDDWPCDRIFTMGLDGSNVTQISRQQGVTTCPFFTPDGTRIIYASTHLVHDSCPPRPDYSMGYVWPLYDAYDIFSCKPDGSDLRRLTTTPGYDAEAVFSADGSKILFTSVRDGDLELYTMDPDGGNVKRLTHEIGYDGGAFFSADGRTIVYRAHHPTDSAEIADYQSLLAQGLIRPSHLEIFIMDADGSHRVQVTGNGAANFCPYFHPNGRQIIFASNQDDPHGRNFDLYLINVDGTGQERITTNDTFDGFPMFSHDGTKLVWCSNRHNAERGETNAFIADWKN